MAYEKIWNLYFIICLFVIRNERTSNLPSSPLCITVIFNLYLLQSTTTFSDTSFYMVPLLPTTPSTVKSTPSSSSRVTVNSFIHFLHLFTWYIYRFPSCKVLFSCRLRSFSVFRYCTDNRHSLLFSLIIPF